MRAVFLSGKVIMVKSTAVRQMRWSKNDQLLQIDSHVEIILFDEKQNCTNLLYNTCGYSLSQLIRRCFFASSPTRDKSLLEESDEHIHNWGRESFTFQPSSVPWWFSNASFYGSGWDFSPFGVEQRLFTEKGFWLKSYEIILELYQSFDVHDLSILWCWGISSPFKL